MSAWLVKQEPSAYPFEKLVEDGRTTWDGVRNPQARANLQSMKRGETVLYYHSGDEKAVVGIAKVARAAYPDPTDDGGEWVAVDLVPVRALERPVTLQAMKADRALADLAVVRQGRLSVSPVGEKELERILALGGSA